jgi:hypothetical protein
MKINWNNKTDAFFNMDKGIWYLCKDKRDETERLVFRVGMHELDRVIYMGSDGLNGWDEYYNFQSRYTIIREVESIDVNFC